MTFTVLCTLFLIQVKSQITITSADIPVPTSPFNNMLYNPVIPPAPSVGTNQVWDYSSYSGATVTMNTFTIETDTFFTNAGIDVSRNELKALTSAGGYVIHCKYDLDVNGVMETAVGIPYQGYSLSAQTGNANDSLIFQPQKYFYSAPKTIMQFPFTANSSWHSVSDRSTDFNISVALLALNHAPSQHRYQIHRNDSIVGWGVAYAYTPGGASIAYDVLLDKYEEYSIDSFYVNGIPASPVLCAAFSIAQGQKSNVQYGYDFYRTGSLNYLVRFNYGTDSSFTTISGVSQNIDNIVTTVNEFSREKYNSVIFPNPSNGNELFIKIENSKVIPDHYLLTDNSGRIIQSGKLGMPDSELIGLRLNNVADGNYFIKLNSGNKNLNTQKILVNH
jgi:hypothetical protein